MPLRCAMRLESRTPKSLVMQKVFSLAAKQYKKPLMLHKNRLILPRHLPQKSCGVGLRCQKITCCLTSSDAKWLQFGLSLQSGLECDCVRCEIPSDSGRAMRATKLVSVVLSDFVWLLPHLQSDKLGGGRALDRVTNKSIDQIGKTFRKMSKNCIFSLSRHFLRHFSDIFDMFWTLYRHSLSLGYPTICPLQDQPLRVVLRSSVWGMLHFCRTKLA